MSKSEMIKWLQNLKEDIGQTQHQDLWHYEEMLDKVISTIEVDEDCISRKWLEENKVVVIHTNDEWGEMEIEECVYWEDIENAPNVVPTVRKNRTTAEPQTYITEDRDTQILDAWQVHHRNITTAEGEPTTEQSSKVGEWIKQGISPYEGIQRCSLCDEIYNITEEFNYCPNCGCKMRG